MKSLEVASRLMCFHVGRRFIMRISVLWTYITNMESTSEVEIKLCQLKSASAVNNSK